MSQKIEKPDIDEQDFHTQVLQEEDSGQQTFCGGALMIGARLRAFRKQQGISIRSLADKCGIGVNTLSMIENDRSSPNVNTLKILADGLEIPIVSFFEEENPESSIIYQKQGRRLKTTFANGTMENLGQGLPPLGAKPNLVTLETTKNEVPLVSHTGRELIYCLEGTVTCEISGKLYPLFSGDSLLFNAAAPHRWMNSQSQPSKLLVLFCTGEAHEEPSGLHLDQ